MVIYCYGVMVWGCFRLSGAGPLSRLDGKFNSAKFLDILSNILESIAQENILPDWIYQQDNSPR